MNYGKINKTDIANGTGVRVSLFVSGCEHYCKGCFNPETWNFKYGQLFTSRTIDEIFEALTPDHIAGLTVLGGEPLHGNNYLDVAWLCCAVKRNFPNKTIWLYTGYDYEDVDFLYIFDFVDVVVDGAFIEDQKDISLKFRGSKNQRIIDVKATRKSGSVKLWEGLSNA